MVFEGASERLEQEQRARAWAVWHTAALSRVQGGKFPTLDSLMGVKRKARQQTVAEMDAIFKAWAMRG